MRRSLVGVFVSAALVMPSAILTHSVAAAPLPLEDGAQSGAVVSPRPKNTRLKNGPVVVVMDTSGSMNEADPNAPGKTKLDTAKAAVNEILGDTSTPFGLVTYPSGPTGEPLPRVDSCESGKVVLIPDNRDFNQNSAVVNGLTADGNTPSGPALKATAHWLSQRGYRDATIVLVTDGNDNCGPDPCDVAKNISATGIDVTVHGIGLSEDEEVKKSLECVAQTTGGEAVSSVKISELKTQLERFASDAVDIEVSAPSHMSVLQNDQFIQIRVSAKDKVVSGSVLSISVKNAAGKSVRLNHSKHIALQTLRPGGQSSTFRIPLQATASDIGTITWHVSVRHYHKDEFGASTLGDYASAKGEIKVVRDTDPTSLGELLQGKKNVVIMGDSYSSGENAPPYIPGSGDEGWENRCHRSPKTHGAVLFPNATILACSGAVTDSFFRHQLNDQPHKTVGVVPQLQALRELKNAPDLVILSIGGNDAGFGSAVTSILGSGTPSSQKERDRYKATILGLVPNDLSGRIVKTLQQIDIEVNSPERLAQRNGAVAPILLLPYPNAVKGTLWPHSCKFSISAFEREILLSFQEKVNSKVEEAALHLKNRPIYFVNTVEDAFRGEDMCASDAPLTTVGAIKGWLTKNKDSILRTAETQQLFHPTERGYGLEAIKIAQWSTRIPSADTRTFEPITEISQATESPRSALSRHILNVMGKRNLSREELKIRCNQVRRNTTNDRVCVTIQTAPYTFFTMYSDPTPLGVFRTGPEVDEVVIALPSTLPPGDHTLVANGWDKDGNFLTGEMPVYIPSVAEENAIILWFWSVVSFIMAGLFGVVTLTVWLLRRKRLKHEA